jgi:nitrite reductase (cytochrome c-552)
MTENPNNQPLSKKSKLPLLAGLAIMALSAVIIVLLVLLSVSIMERRWEAQRPAIAVTPIADWEPDNAVWGQNYPREYESYRNTEITDTRTQYGGAFPRDYLENDPRQVILFAGYGFSEDYLQARGHYYAVTDVVKTKRIKEPYNAGTCMTCKSTDVPRLMNTMGVAEFYAANFHDLKKEVTHPLGCQDCHDPRTMNLRITRPALREAFTAMGQDINKATHQEMRSLVCAQCHVEYYFKPDPKNYLTFPWAKGTTVESVIEYYDAYTFTDYVHPISQTPVIKAQHPDWELYKTGIHAYRNVSCADCHMPYRTEGGIKYTDHHVRSPLLNISNSCSVCHRWSEEDIRTRVEAIQDKVQQALTQTEEALVKAHFDIAEAMKTDVDANGLREARQMLRHAQFRWDYISASNGRGFHSPQESMRILGDAVNQAQEARLLVARLLSQKGIALKSSYPDISTRPKAQEVIQAFISE